MLHSHDLTAFLILIGMATLLAAIFRTLKLPTIVGFILAGVLAGPSALDLVKSLPGQSILSEVTILFLMFTIGLEFSFKELWRIRRTFAGLGFLQIGLCLAFVMVLSRLGLGFGLGKSFLIGCVVAMSSTAVVMKLLEEARDTNSPQGNACISVLLFQDLAIIPISLVLPLFGSPRLRDTLFDFGAVGPLLLRVGLTGALILVMTRYVVPFLFDWVARTKSREIFFFTVLLSCLGSAMGVEALGGTLSLGAFVAGMMISGSPYGRQVSAEMTPMRDSFLGLFFTTVGMQLDLRFFVSHWPAILALFLSVIFIKAFTTGLAAVTLRKSSLVAVGTGLILAQIGEFSFVLAQQGRQLQMISAAELQYILSTSVMTMVATPFIYQFCVSKRFYNLVGIFDPTTGRPKVLGKFAFTWPGKARGPAILADGAPKSTVVPVDHRRAADHVIIIGFGVAGQQLAQALRHLGIPYTVLEMNYALVKAHARKGEPIIFGDALSRDNLEHAGLPKAKEIVITASGGAALLQGIISSVRALRPDIPLIIRTQYLLEARELQGLGENASVVVGELETSLEILLRALAAYDVSPAQVHEILTRTKADLRGRARNVSAALRRNVDAVTWQALADLIPLHVKEGAYAVGRGLVDLHLRARTGASVVAVFRDGEGVRVPGSDYQVRVGDVLHIIAPKDSHQAARDYMETGRLKVAT